MTGVTAFGKESLIFRLRVNGSRIEILDDALCAFIKKIAIGIRVWIVMPPHIERTAPQRRTF
jgi:hypothetical protein